MLPEKFCVYEKNFVYKEKSGPAQMYKIGYKHLRSIIYKFILELWY